ncbi:hypothetical protein [Dyadobacter sp. LHD-138]|uniref:hypothetical protein n=1 Tax=Dyadobacter sp. LHD-138 TaxID=3071413 RepID=UPI0027E07F36|nr:hypothetical protein [Dyadobacter sp. LHD-138]MDQ6477262.1 hypothetical protein [Dyadobacter sp. LHD-138]
MAILLVGSIGCDLKQKSDARTTEIAMRADSTTYTILNESEIQSIPFYDTSQYAIFPVSYARLFLGDAQQATLNEKEILVIECAVRKSVTLYNDRRGAFLIDLKKYKRQYFPGITASGNLEVWVRCIREDVIENFSRSSTPYDWRKDNKVIHDGGDGVFSLKVNLTTHKTYDFVTNGSETL